MFIFLPFGAFQNEAKANLFALINKSVIYNIMIVIRSPEMNISSIIIYDPRKNPPMVMIPVNVTGINNVFPNKKKDLN